MLKQFTINPSASDPNTHKPLRTDGSWLIGKNRPESCPEAAKTCVEVFYTVPDQSAKCSWTVSMNENGTDGTILNENGDADTYMLRKLSDSDAKPLIKSRAKPVYPAIARAANVTGDVIVRVVVGKSGEIQAVRPVSGAPMLLPASIDAAKKWTFEPLKLSDRTVPYETQLVFSFSLFLPSGSVKVAP